jgi:hypothetical protein
MIPKKCKYCSYLDYVEDDDGDTRTYRYICTKESRCNEEEE